MEVLCCTLLTHNDSALGCSNCMHHLPGHMCLHAHLCCRFLDKGLDEVGPKGLDFLTVLAAHEGEGLVVDRQAAVAGSRSPLFKGTTGQRSDLSIIEVGLFFRTELLAAAAAALAEAGVSAVVDDQLGQEAQPVILVTNDHAQLQLAKSHGLPAFKLAGEVSGERVLLQIVYSLTILHSA